MAKQNTKTAKPVNKANEAALAKFLTDTTEVRDLKAKIKEMETIVKERMDNIKDYAAQHATDLGFKDGKCALSNGIQLTWKESGTTIALREDTSDKEAIEALSKHGYEDLLTLGYDKKAIAAYLADPSTNKNLEEYGITGVKTTLSLLIK